jgi:hypothetical protein
MEYKNAPNPITLNEIEKTLSFIRKNAKGLIEKPGDSKWTKGHTVFAFPEDGPGLYTYMVGALKSGKVTFHVMPMYGVAEMKEKWTQVLAPFTSGKSCLNFDKFGDLPKDALLDITKNGTGLFKKEMDAYNANRAKKRK